MYRFPCQTINYALGRASGGDTIQVASGTYTESLTLDKPVSLLGAGEENTWVRAITGQRVVTITGETITNSTIISGFSFTGGNPADEGGGMLVITSTPTIRNNRIISNTAGAEGGGLYILNSDGLILNNNRIMNNENRAAGGGVFFYNCPNAIVAANTIMSNTGWRGGGLYVHRSPGATLSANAIISNTAGAGWGIKQGGGLYILSSDNVTLTDNEISGNVSWNNGGGLYSQACANIKLERNKIANNRSGVGSGLFLRTSRSATLINSVITDNHPNEGMYIVASSSVHLLHTTIARNGSGNGIGLYVDSFPSDYSSVALTNTVLVSHMVGISVTEGNTVAANGVLWYDTPITVSLAPGATATVQHQHEGHPAFVDFTTGDYHISPGSAAIDAGVEEGVKDDIDGDPRLDVPDLGADEICRVYLPLVLRSFGY